jgi:hypothetical protein
MAPHDGLTPNFAFLVSSVLSTLVSPFITRINALSATTMFAVLLTNLVSTIRDVDPLSFVKTPYCEAIQNEHKQGNNSF